MSAKDPSLTFTRRGDDDVGPFTVARFVAGELSAQDADKVRAALDRDPALAAEAQRLEADKQAFALSHRFADLEKKLGPAEDKGGVWAWLTGPKLAGLSALVGACALVAVVAVPSGEGPTPDGPMGEAGIRLKGGQHLGVFVKEQDGVRLSVDGEVLRPGDQIQFVLKDHVGAKARVVVGIDGKGAVSVYDARGLTEDPAGAGPAVLEESLILDDSTGPERFFVVYGTGSPKALLDRVKTAAEDLAGSGADLSSTETLNVDGVVQSSTYIVKAARADEQRE